MSKWKPAATAPKGKTIILLCGDEIVLGYRKDDAFYVYNNGDYFDGGYGNDYRTVDRLSQWFAAPQYTHPTHWMPLPNPPKQEA
jgi:hypothetical protein